MAVSQNAAGKRTKDGRISATVLCHLASFCRRVLPYRPAERHGSGQDGRWFRWNKEVLAGGKLSLGTAL